MRAQLGLLIAQWGAVPPILVLFMSSNTPPFWSTPEFKSTVTALMGVVIIALQALTVKQGSAVSDNTDRIKDNSAQLNASFERELLNQNRLQSELQKVMVTNQQEFLTLSNHLNATEDELLRLTKKLIATQDEILKSEQRIEQRQQNNTK